MKTFQFSKFMLLAILMTLVFDGHADAEAKRKNKCKRNDKFYKACAQTKGGTSNCGNLTTGFGWRCHVDNNQNATSIIQRHSSGGGACSCGDFANPNLTKAAEAAAQSNATIVTAGSTVHQFGCKWPNKWKAGASSNFSTFHTCSPLILTTSSTTENYISSSYISTTDTRFDYINKTVTLSGLTGQLKKYTPDMVNDYATFMIDISLVTGEDSEGNEIEQSLYRCKATIYDDELVIDDPNGIFTTSDFSSSELGDNGKIFTLTSSSKVISLPTDITDESEINVTLSSDCGNYEEGGGERYAVNPALTEKISEEIRLNQIVSFNLLSNPVVSGNIEFNACLKDVGKGQLIKFLIRNETGATVKTVELFVSDKITPFNINSGTLPDGVYFLSLIYKNKEYGRKIILDND